MLKRNFKLIGAALFVSVFFYSCTQDQNSPEEEATFSENDSRFDSQNIEGQYIVVFNKNMIEDVNSKYPKNYSKAQEAMADQTRKVLANASIYSAEIINVYSKTLSGATLKLTKAQVQQLKGKKEIAYIEQDRIVVFAPPCGTPKGGPCGEEPDPGTGGSQETPYGITRVNGGGTYDGAAVAWIVDTGIDITHPDLNVKASRGFNAFTSGRDSKSLDDGHGHGTHVSGTIAAIDNDFGVIGVAPGATVIPVKVLDSRGSGSYSGVIAGVDWVGAKGTSGDVANLSLGGPVSQALDDAILAASSKGIKFALAAGNESSDANNSSPARVNSIPGNTASIIVTISAMDVNDKWAYFSNYGNPPVDFAAPGLYIKSTWKGGGYNTISGTSMAAPHAAGVLLLGAAKTDGFVKSDPDENSDPIIVH